MRNSSVGALNARGVPYTIYLPMSRSGISYPVKFLVQFIFITKSNLIVNNRHRDFRGVAK